MQRASSVRTNRFGSINSDNTPITQELILRRPLLLTVLIICAGCTTLRPIEGSPTELAQRLNSGELLKTGDRVLIITTDQKQHRFTVKSVGAGLIQGPSESIPVEQISSLEKRQFSRGKTIALVGGIVGGAAFGLIVYGLAEYAGAFALR
jgi:hypothetical protein